jgi:hypothetical protein
LHPVSRLKGKDATAKVYKVDTALLAELRNHERQAAQELGHWDTKSEAAGLDQAEMIRILHEGRRRARGNCKSAMRPSAVPTGHKERP